MADEARNVRNFGLFREQADGTVTAYEVRQARTGEACVHDDRTAGVATEHLDLVTRGQYRVKKNTAIAFLSGGRVYWDHSANEATFRRLNDRDFYLGRAVADADASNPEVEVDLNAPEFLYDCDLVRDGFVSAIVGTQALGGLAINPRGGALDFVLSSTNEAQKLDALSLNGFATGANAIVECAFCVPSDGAGTVVDVSLGVASGTHATDADSIAQHLLMHLDANNTAIRFQSKDGTTTVASTDSTKTYTEGQSNADGVRKEVWFDMRDPTDVAIYVDGVRVLTGTTFDVSAAASTWRLLAHVEKTASTDTYEFQLDWLRFRLGEQ